MRGLPGRGGIGPPTAPDVRCPECMGDERDGKDCSGNGRHDMRGATHVINGTCVKCGEGGTFSATPNGRLSTGRLSTTGTSTLNSLARKHAAGKEYVLTDRGRSLRILEVRDINELEEEVGGRCDALQYGTQDHEWELADESYCESFRKFSPHTLCRTAGARG